jgi:heme-degrading monooxygenase HmoA
MIGRTWHGITRAAHAEQYLAYLRATGLPEYRATPGNLGVTVLRRIDGDECHWLLLTLWESIDAVRAFAGPDVEMAKYYPEDEQFLLALEPHVTHYEVVEVLAGDAPGV